MTESTATPARSPLHEEHLALGAQMVEFGGFLMPVQYTSIIAEHLAVRKAAGLFDTSHMGEFLVSGKDAEIFLQRMLANDVRRCTSGVALYSPLCLPDGGTIDDLYLYNLRGTGWKGRDDSFMLVVNAANTAKDFAWLQQQLKEQGDEVTVKDISTDIAMLALQGPKAERILQPLTTAKLTDLKRFHEVTTTVAEKEVLISRTGYTAEEGFEFYLPATDAVTVWRAILKEGKPRGLLPTGLGARDTLRLEACYPLYGHELNEQTSPVEAGIGWTVKKSDIPCIGSDVLLTQKKEGATRKVIAFEMKERAIPRQHYSVLRDGEVIGEVTSGTLSPLMKKSIGLALIERGKAAIGESILIKIREREVEATVVKKPFYSFAGR